jgi:hypothetical protein
MVRILASLLICGLVISPVYAQTDSSDFSIRVFGGTDTEAPTTPVLSGSAIAQNQIDLSWSTAVDNFFVSGYALFRDGLPIATTSQTVYSDVGLMASTTYSYTVRAFDPAFNYSSSSNSVSLTTFSAPPPPSPSDTNSAGGTATRVVLNSINIDTAERSATFLVETARPARFEIRWGRTSSYELGYTVNDVYVRSYKTTLTDLEPGTKYYYEVVGYTPFGAATVLEKGSFSTVSVAASFPPTNVRNFTALRNGSDVRLAWELPLEEEVASVKLVRSHLGFPAHVQDGVVVYQGLGSAFEDKDVLTEFSPVYYTAFVVDKTGAVSSGAVARVYALQAGAPEGGDRDIPIPSGLGGEGKEETVASTSPQVPAGTRLPQLEEIFLLQNETRVSLVTQGIVLDSEAPFLLSIPQSAVSENLKTIIASLTDPTDSRRTYSFMLRLNKDGTAYEAALPPTLLEGVSRLIIDIYDYESLVVANYQKTITFKQPASGSELPVFPDQIIHSFVTYGWMIAAPLLFFIVLLLWFRRRPLSLEDKQ